MIKGLKIGLIGLGIFGALFAPIVPRNAGGIKTMESVMSYVPMTRYFLPLFYRHPDKGWKFGTLKNLA